MRLHDLDVGSSPAKPVQHRLEHLLLAHRRRMGPDQGAVSAVRGRPRLPSGRRIAPPRQTPGEDAGGEREPVDDGREQTICGEHGAGMC
jgi:hypothetical protein